MNKIILTILLAGLFFPTILSATVRKVTLTGRIRGLGNNEIILLNVDRSEIVKTTCKNDKFKIVADLETDDLRFYTLYAPSVGPLGPSMSIPTLFLFIDSPKIDVQAKIEDKKIIKEKIKGSPGMTAYENIFKNLPVRKKLSIAGKKYNEVFHEYNMVEQSEKNMKALKQASHILDSLSKVESQEILALLPQYPKSKELALIISQYFRHLPVDKLEVLYNQFDTSIRDCFYLKEMETKINQIKACAVGQPAPDFELQDLNGNWIKLSSLRGKYILIDFWASWCGPCRKEIPNLKKVYAEFKNQGLQVIGVSTDSSPDKWKKAVEEEQLDYLQLHDPKLSTGIKYNYNGIPFIILISPEGIILEKGLRGVEVREKINKYISQSKACAQAPFLLSSKKLNKVLKSQRVEFTAPYGGRNEFLLSAPTDSTGVFTLSGQITPGKMGFIQLRKDYIRIPIYAESQNYTVTEENGNYYIVSEQQNSYQNRYTEFLKKQDVLTKEYEQLSRGLEKIKDIQKKDALSAKLSAKFQEKLNLTLAGIKEFSETEIAQQMLCDILYVCEVDHKIFTKAMEALGENSPESDLKKRIFDEYEKSKGRQLTGIAPNFELSDASGKLVRLSDFRGKYVLLDFWASWCAPCRKKNKELNGHYDTLKSAGVEVISVSLDDDKNKWLQAVKEDRIKWLQLADLNGFKKSTVRTDYKVQQVPTVYLINPEGQIIDKGLSLDEILQQIKK